MGTTSRAIRGLTVGALVALLGVVGPGWGAARTAAPAATSVPPSAVGGYPSDSAKPDAVKLTNGFEDLWTSDGRNDLHGTVLDPKILQHNDDLAVWINRHATADQQFRALQDAQYDGDGRSYDQSITVSTGLGSVLGPLYVQGRHSGALPLTSALINSQNGSAGAYLDTGAAKDTFSYPRPYLPSDPGTPAAAGDDPACDPAVVNGSSLTDQRTGRADAAPDGNLLIDRVAPATDGTHAFAPHDVALDPDYGSPSLCLTGSFPSGHTTTAYLAGITLATLLPELAPEILARASENGNNRVVLGVHYPLDVVGGRIIGEAALATRWSDDQFRTDVLEPARRELVDYLQAGCGGSITFCAAEGQSYSDDPYGGQAMPGGSAQVVTGRTSAVEVYTERLTYGFPQVGTVGLHPSVPDDAPNLLLTTFPTLTDGQRLSVLAQTQIDSGYPLDRTDSGDGSWQRLNLAAAMSASVRVNADGSVTVLSVGDRAQVVSAGTDPAADDPASGSADDRAAYLVPLIVLLVAGVGLVVVVAVRRSRRGPG